LIITIVNIDRFSKFFHLQIPEPLIATAVHLPDK